MRLKNVSEWKDVLRAGIRAAMVAKDKAVLAVLRETLAAIENAEAPPATSALAADASEGPFAASVAGLGAGDIARLELSPEQVAALMAREIKERRDAAAEYLKLGQKEQAELLSAQADKLTELAKQA